MTLVLHRTAWIAILILAVVSTVVAFLAFLGGLRASAQMISSRPG